MFHDVKYGGYSNPHPRKKDVCDVDLYQKIAASYVLYLDKRKLERYVTEVNMSDNKLKVLMPEADLVAIIIHSIIPEMLCTLFVYYATLYYTAKMDSEEIKSVMKITNENNVRFSAKAHCSLIAELHKAAHGLVPEKIEAILAELDDETRRKRILLENDFKMPHKYGLSSVVRILLEKIKESAFRRSVFKQMMHILNPKVAKWVIYNIIWRCRRETY